MHRPRSDPNLDPECRLEAVTLESEISMSVITEASRAANDSRLRQRRFFDRLTGRRPRNDTGITDLTEIEEKKTCASFNVEPAFLLIAFGLGIQMNSSPLFTLWARCIELAEQYHGPGANATAICSSLSDKNSSDFNDIVEKDIASTRIYIQLAATIPTVIVSPIIGNWSDHHGRKKPLIFALCGMILSYLLQLISTLTYESISIYDFAFAAEIVFALCGGAGAVFTSILSMITDECRLTGFKPGNSEVPMRIAIAAGLQGIGGMFGALVMSWLSVPAIQSIDDHVGAYVKSAILSLFMVVAAFVYTVAFVRETHRPGKDIFEYENDDEERDYLVDESVTHGKKSCCGRVKEKLKQLVEVMTERRPGYTRFCLNLSLMFVFVEFLVIDSNLLFLYVKRQPFAFSDRMFSLLGFFRGLCMFVGMLGMPLLLRKTKLLGQDSILIGLGVLSGAVSYFFTSFATTNEEIIFATVLTLFAGGISPGYRSFLPRMVPKEQTARLLTCISIIMAFCPILSSAVFNNLYNWSLDFWPGLPFFVGGVFQAVVVVGQILIHCLMRPQWILAEQLRSQRLVEEDDEEDSEERREEERRRLMGGLDDDRSVSNEAVGSSSPTESAAEGAIDGTPLVEERRPVIL
ncbi:hypothetical protein PFISCL1PPCAC_3806 [Pristionchus fissidentatus]|uniref:Membrane transporter n=1 Tax=Pristionchus fissidentatus TaxID=1538716 RepID=A0AAV5V1Q2_9BILA|nr:hypothetical protein PFISCL1PPCAC_3806 [Pristionchus fissidentatus]